jgi:hypothetical protein
MLVAPAVALADPATIVLMEEKASEAAPVGSGWWR